jgi:multidrug efflux system membrane fusion protein
VIWIASGLGDAPPETEARAQRGEGAAMRVSVRTSTAKTITREIVVSARTEPDRAVEVKAETEGLVVTIGAERGAFVAAGRPIVELDMRDREARLAETEALIRQRELEYEAAERLLDQQFISASEFAGIEAFLVGARAARERILLDIEHTAIAAPFDAVVFDRLVEVGDYVAAGDPIAQLVDTDPLIVVGNVNESDIGALAVGGAGIARVLAGPEIAGIVRYLAPVAEESTRSFRVELAIPNPGFALPAGTSAQLLLGGEEITAHTRSAALLARPDDGTVGVKSVDANNRVQFLPIEIAGSTPEGMLVTGLPLEVSIISVGQGFVADGQVVIPVEDSADTSARPSSELSATQNERTY